MRRILHWMPRVLAVGVALFLALFALDVFGEFDTLTATLVALTKHLIPTLLLLAAAVIAWRFPFVGGVIFLVLGGVSVLMFDTYEESLSFLLISTPVFVVGVLFLWDAFRGKTPERSRQA